MKNHCTCPHCCQTIEIEAEGRVSNTGKVRCGIDKNSEAGPTNGAQPKEKAIGGKTKY